MRKLLQLIFLITVLAIGVQAQIEISDINAGNGNQNRNITISTDVIIKNLGSENQTVTLSLQNVNDRYQPNLSTTEIANLPAGNTSTVILQLYVPDNQDSGKYEIGRLRAQYSTQTIEKAINLETRSNLEIKDLDIQVGSDSDSNLENGEKISKEAKPGDKVTFDFTIKNTFSNAEDIDITDIELAVTIKNIDDDDDLEETRDFDLSATDSTTESIEFTIPNQVDEDEYDVEIELTGEDENRAKHTVNWTLKLEINKEKDAIIITRAELGKTSAGCEESNTLLVKVKNIGSRSQHNARITAENEKLGINFDVKDIFLNKNINKDDNEFSRTFTLTIPGDTPSGNYPIRVKLFREFDEPMDVKDVTFQKNACALNEPEPEPEEEEEQEEEETLQQEEETLQQEEEEEQQQQTITATEQRITGATVTSIEVPFTESKRFIVLLIAANIIVLLSIAGMTVALMKR